MWDTRFNEHDVKEIRTKTTAYLGVGAIAKMDAVAAELTLPQPAPNTAYASPCTTR